MTEPIVAIKFLRKSYITILETPIGEEDRVVKQVWGYDQNDDATLPTGLRLTFAIDKKLVDVADTATLKIYNLNQNSRRELAQRSIYLYKTARVRTLQISAGYPGDFGGLFNGGVELVTNTRQGADWITEIKSSSALSQMLYNMFDKSWQSKGGTPMIDIFEEMATGNGGLGKPIYSDGAKTKLQETKITKYHASGSVFTSIRKMIKSMGLTFTMDNGQLIVTEQGQPIDDDVAKAIVISEASGLVGSPRINDMGYEFRTLIDHRLTTGQLVIVKSQTLEESTPGLGALATIWGMAVRGDTHEDDWYMDVTTMFFPPILQPLTNIGQQPAYKPEDIVL